MTSYGNHLIVGNIDVGTEVVNVNLSEYDIFVGRPSKWGNPFIIGRDGTRAEVIAQYETWIRAQSQLMNVLLELDDKRLGCFCKPLDCHADVLVRLVKEYHINKSFE